MKNIKTYTAILEEESDQEALNRAMRYSAMFGPSSTVEELLDRGADINSEDPGNGRTALHKAAFLGNEQMARVLLGRGADPNQGDWHGNPPLYLHLDGQPEPGDVPGTEEHMRFTKFMILNGADPLKAFDTPEDMMEYFNGDIDWMPEALRAKIKRMQKGKSAFGM
jgi:ankyrin repeat protein